MDFLLQGLLLGISTGVFCLGYCAPVLIPFMMAEQRTLCEPVRVVFEVMTGRLLAYVAVGIAMGILGTRLDGESLLVQRASGAAMVGMGVLLALFLIRRLPTSLGLCHWAGRLRAPYPLLLGALTGVNVCPPFLAAIALGVTSMNVLSSTAIFVGFFVGTSLFLLPVIPLGWASRWDSARTVGRMAGALSALFLVLLGGAQLVR